MIYKNISKQNKEYYGEIFAPGETKKVSGYIHDKKMIVSTLPSTREVKKQEKRETKVSKKIQITTEVQEEKPVEPVEQKENIIKEEENNG